ncbi:MAG: hypothetical protein KatS3mg105_4862 [Gemmatales bacterium]|nr:MAG: hypothetical protein KatS3mg105_4862 [Gemmatales bacterium]
MARWKPALLFVLLAANSLGAEPNAKLGEKALLSRAFNPPIWTKKAYDEVWKQWGIDQKPENYHAAFAARYGLHPAPYDNGGYPMGIRETTFLFKSTIATDCLMCHGGSIAGKSYVGLGNASLDIQTLYEEMNAADGRKAQTPFVFSYVRGTNEAGNMSVFLLSYRTPDLVFQRPPRDLRMREFLCEDVPAWWLLKKKKTMYHTGGADARSVRSLMQFMMHPLNRAEDIYKAEKDFRHIQAYLLDLQPPEYPFAIDKKLARDGERLFVKHCAKCHGTYGDQWTYPNRIVPIEVIGTDRTRFDGISKEFGRYYNRSWFAREKKGWYADDYLASETVGYQAPPLDGLWATAPYLHNGSVPTVYHVLNSKARPVVYTRSFRTGVEDYDAEKLGWKFVELKNVDDQKLSPMERRRIYDTRLPGRGNGGHRFGDRLSEQERWAIIEYLKTL